MSPSARFRYQLSVRWSDIDSYGHVNNVRYFDYLQEARIAFLLQVLPGGLGAAPALLARQVVDYKRPMTFRPEPYAVDQWIERVGRTSVTIGGLVLGAGEEEPYARASSVLVRVDLAAGTPIEIPEPERASYGRWSSTT